MKAAFVPSGWISHTPSEPVRFVWWAIQAALPVKGDCAAAGAWIGVGTAVEAGLETACVGSTRWGTQDTIIMTATRSKVVLITLPVIRFISVMIFSPESSSLRSDLHRYWCPTGHGNPKADTMWIRCSWLRHCVTQP
jgi:hypothetical protein